MTIGSKPGTSERTCDAASRVSRVACRFGSSPETASSSGRSSKHAVLLDKGHVSLYRELTLCRRTCELSRPGSSSLIQSLQGPQVVVELPDLSLALEDKSCFFGSAQRVEGIRGPMPAWMELLHAYYARLWWKAEQVMANNLFGQDIGPCAHAQGPVGGVGEWGGV